MEKRGLRVLEKIVPKLRPNWEEARGDWGTLFNEGLNDICSSPDIRFVN
jgi:hypothetical protein